MNNDLISKSELKKAIETWDKFACLPDGKLYPLRELKHPEMFVHYMRVDDVTTAIDNAPIVDIPDLEEYEDMANALNMASELLHKKRPQGKWIARGDMDYLDENKVVHNHFECNKCGFIHDFLDGHTSQYNFCPNCVADMR